MKYEPSIGCGDTPVCNCGHPYYRHFDTYDAMLHCGCKYCDCITPTSEEIDAMTKKLEKQHCIHPVNKLTARLNDVSIYGGCETCGWGERTSGNVQFKCECGTKFSIYVDSGHEKWHALVVSNSLEA